MVRYVAQATSGSGSATLPAESIVVWDVGNDDGVTVTTTTTSGDSTVAGIISVAALTQDTVSNTAAQDVGKDNWTWLQTYGYAQVRVLGRINTAGDAMGTSTTADEAGDYHIPPAAGKTARTVGGVAGFFYDSSAAAADDVEVFLKGLD